MPRQRFLNLTPAARRELLGVATKHFARHGFERASLNEILAEAGISKGAYYYYFDDKDDLFATALEDALDALLEKHPVPSFEGLSARTFWPAVEAYVASWAAALDASSDLFRIVAQLTEAQRRSPRFASMLARANALYRVLVSAGQRLGCVRRDLPEEVLVRLLEANDAALDSLFLTLHPRATPADVRAHVALVFDTFRRLLVAAPPARPTGSRRGRG